MQPDVPMFNDQRERTIARLPASQVAVGDRYLHGDGSTSIVNRVDHDMPGTGSTHIGVTGRGMGVQSIATPPQETHLISRPTQQLPPAHRPME